MPAFVIPKLLARAETGGADIYPIPALAGRVGAFYADGMGEVAGAGVALDLQAWLAHSCYVIKGKVREKLARRLETGHKIPSD